MAHAGGFAQAPSSPVGYGALHKEIKKFENQYRGRELPGFVNYRTFETIIKEQIRSLEEPAVDMLHRVTGECTWHSLAFAPQAGMGKQRHPGCSCPGPFLPAAPL